ncbi:MAG: hypothetical protein JXJ19_02625 [Elusimicrobia bacterium]|nr:hypothetical protein [Elusimicrobiota bacterium]
MLKKIKKLYGRWVEIGKKVASFQIRVLFTIVYFIFIVPFGYMFKLLTPGKEAGWQDAAEEKIDIDKARRQF